MQVSPDYTPLEYHGLEMNEWYELALKTIEQAFPLDTEPPAVERGRLPIILRPPSQDPFAFLDWSNETTNASGRYLTLRIEQSSLPEPGSRVAVMFKTTSADGEAVVRLNRKTPHRVRNKISHALPHAFGNRPKNPAWVRADLIAIGESMSIMQSETPCWGGLTFTVADEKSLAVEVVAPTSSSLEICSDAHLFHLVSRTSGVT